MPTLIERLAGAVKGFRTGAGGQLQTAAVAPLTRDFIAGVTGGLSMKRLGRILDEADGGDILEQHRLFMMMEDRDDHIHAELSKRRRALLGLEWQIMPGVVGDKTAEAVAQEVREQFDQLPDFEDLILDLADAIGHGFACLEIEWGWDGKLHLPVAFHHRPQTWFTLSEDRAELRFRSLTSGIWGDELQPLGWIVHRHRAKSGWLARSGLFRTLAWTWLLKAYCRGDFAEFLEIHGLPLRVGKYPAGASDEELRTLRMALSALGHDAAGIIPDGMLIEFEEAASGSEKPFVAMHDICERGQSKAILGGTLTSQADGKSSTNALGRVHEEVRQDILAADSRQIATTISRQLLAPLAVLNVGVTDARQLPYLQFDTGDAADLQEMATALPALATVMKISARWAHDRCRIPMPEEGEEVLAAPAAKVPAAGQAPAAGLTALVAALAAAAPRAQADPQLELDAAEAQDMDAAMEQLLAPLFTELRGGLPPEELLARLADLYPRMDATALQELLARAIFAAELHGRLAAQQGR